MTFVCEISFGKMIDIPAQIHAYTTTGLTCQHNQFSNKKVFLGIYILVGIINLKLW
jgi:hypothetical protein